MPTYQELTCVSLFTGAGGLDLGLERAGFKTLAALDFDEDCVETLRLNQAAGVALTREDSETHLSGAAILHGDVADVTTEDLLAGARRGGQPTVLAGGPPCQPFSSAGRQKGIHDPRGQLFEHFVRLAGEMQPQYILFENVRGLATARGVDGIPGQVLARVRDMFEGVGYATRFALLNSADYGSPQRRVRLFMLGTRIGSPPQFPPATHGKNANSDLVTLPWVSLGDFLRGLPQPPPDDDVVEPSTNLARQLADVRDGSGLRSPGRVEPSRPGGHWGYKQGTFIANLQLPARTVTAASTQDWVRLPGQPLRRLTLRECASLQGFPGEWVFAGSKASRFRQIGNAVPLIFGEVLGRAIAKHAEQLSPDEPLTSAPIPKAIQSAIAYTHRDDARNGSVRPRSPRYGT
jgi:DNA (cytosine-5)-methyltransferase 1